MESIYTLGRLFLVEKKKLRVRSLDIVDLLLGLLEGNLKTMVYLIVFNQNDPGGWIDMMCFSVCFFQGT